MCKEGKINIEVKYFTLPMPMHIILITLSLIFLFFCGNDKKNPVDNGNTYTPVPPSSLTAKLISSYQIDLKWKDNSVDEQLFRVERKETSEKYIEIATVPANTTQYSATDLKKDTEYAFRVRVYNDYGNSKYSNEVSLKTDLYFVRMVSIPGGSFLMGSTNGQWDEIPVHIVTVSSFEISIYEIN